jgi:predicted HAD superfamily Cof-like phosphohydrolase
MKTYSYIEPGLENKPVEVVYNEAEILFDYWPHWKERMVKKYGEGHELITDENCIEDWVTVNWATEIKMTNFEKVKEFTAVFGQDVSDTPRFPAKDVIKLRVELIREEFQELKDAIKDKDLVEVADALTDILYVTYGAGVAFGIDLDACLAEVHRSNMTKLGADGKPVHREDGKIIKGPNYEKPNLKPILGVN